MTSVEQIRAWFDNAPEGTTHVFVVRDMFDYGDYSEYFTGTPIEARKHYHDLGERALTRVMEVYNTALPFESQARQFRCFEFGG